MSTLEQKTMIFEYWFRVFIGLNITIGDITEIAVEFADEYDMFTTSLTYGPAIIENNGQLLKSDANYLCDAFGIVNAIKGGIYHWKIKVLNPGNCDLNIGIVIAENTENSKDDTPF